MSEEEDSIKQPQNNVEILECRFGITCFRSQSGYYRRKKKKKAELIYRKNKECTYLLFEHIHIYNSTGAGWLQNLHTHWDEYDPHSFF